MSNCELIDLPLLDIESHQVTEALRCILHTIIFNRSLGSVSPREVDSELFDLTWVHCGDTTVDTRVETKVAAVQSWVDKNPGRRVQVCLSFFERRQQQGWFLRQEQRLYWEQWTINLALAPSDSTLEEDHPLEFEALRARRKQVLQLQLETALTHIICAVNEKRDHIPPVVSGATLTFPFDVTLEATAAAGGESSSSSLFGIDLMKRMLSSTHPPSRTRKSFQALLGASSSSPSSSAVAVATTATALKAASIDVAAAYACCPAALTAAANVLRSKLANNKQQCIADFAALEALQVKLNRKHSFSVGKEAFSADLNRYSDVLPYDHNRIKLLLGTTTTTTATTTTTTTTTNLQEEYINASSLIVCMPRHRGYIATQGPLPNTCAAFWRMIVQQQVRVIVMLTDLVEGRRKKCHPYFPTKVGSTTVISAGGDGGSGSGGTAAIEKSRISVRTTFVEQVAAGLVRRTMNVQGIGSTVWVCEHFHFSDWADHGVPPSPAPLLTLLARLRRDDDDDDTRQGTATTTTTMKEMKNSSSTTLAPSQPPPPIAVHCSAGIGRSGVFCVLDVAIRQLLAAAAAVVVEEKEEGGGQVNNSAKDLSAAAACAAVDMLRIVESMRAQRAGMVQTSQQLIFCHSAMLALVEAALDEIEAPAPAVGAAAK